MSELTVIADYGDLCGEGPLWNPDSRALYWTDQTGLKFHRYCPSTSQHEVVKEGLEICGFAFNQPGGFAITNTSGIWLWD